MSDINSFKKSLLDPTNKQSYAGQVIDQGSRSGYADMLGAQVVLGGVKAAEDKPLPAYVGPALDRFLSGDVGKALDKFLPGHKSGNVPLTAGAVRQSIEYLDMLKTPISSAVGRPQFEAVIKEQRAGEIVNFYREADSILRDGTDKIDSRRFAALVSRYIKDRSVEKYDDEKYNDEVAQIVSDQAAPGDRPIELSVQLRIQMAQFVKKHNENVQQYDNQQSRKARELLEDARDEVGDMLVGDALTQFKDELKTKEAEEERRRPAEQA